MPTLAYLLVIATCCTIQALPACPIFDGSAPNSVACFCEQGTKGECAAGDYCLKGGDQTCSYFPRCRSVSVKNLNNCVRCAPENDFACAECKSSTFLKDGECVRPPSVFVTEDLFVANRVLPGEEDIFVWGPENQVEFVSPELVQPDVMGINNIINRYGQVRSGPKGFVHMVETPGKHHQLRSTDNTHKRALAMLSGDGTVTVLGNDLIGGTLAGSNPNDYEKNVRAIYAGGKAFVAILHNKRVIAWGDPKSGGCIPGSKELELVGVTAIESTQSAFAAIIGSGTVVAWGNPEEGGEIPSNIQAQLVDVQELTSTSLGAFAARLASGKVVAWGKENVGGVIPANLQEKLNQRRVRKIFSTQIAFAAVTVDGDVVAWSKSAATGSIISGTDVLPQLTKVRTIFTTNEIFLALLDTGKVVGFGGRATLEVGFVPDLDNVRMITALQMTSNRPATDPTAFAALLNDGTVHTFGGEGLSGMNPNGKCNNPSSETRNKLKNVMQIFATRSAFAALKADGTVVTWGGSEYGGVIPDKSYHRFGLATKDFRPVGGPNKVRVAIYFFLLNFFSLISSKSFPTFYSNLCRMSIGSWHRVLLASRIFSHQQTLSLRWWGIPPL